MVWSICAAAAAGSLDPRSRAWRRLSARSRQRLTAGDHLLVVAEIDRPRSYVDEHAAPLIRFRGRYPALR